jgi:glycosyltransferase involved in cell wall biosynthesis
MERWALHVATPAALWFAEHLKPEALAADQHSFLWRRRKLGDHVWREADNFQVLGIWYIYLHMASGGQIATVRDAVMRIPFAAALPNLDQDDSFRLDRARLITEVQSFWSVPSGILGAAPKLERTKRHLLIVTHGLFAGGAENLPIQMANALVARGVIVSLLIFKVDVNPEMRATLDPGISIFEADWVMEYGCDRFIRDAGFSLIHSHGVIGEMFFFRLCEEKLPIPYVSTLHGSYEASSSTELPESFIAKIVRNVDLFIYTADKNLGPLLRHDVHPDRVIKMINAMPVDPVPFPRSRAELGIAEDAIVFTLIARGIPEKGWSTAINAFKAVQRRNPHRPVHLCLVGEGDEPDRLCPLHADDPSISFLGFQLRIHGLYRLTDVAIAPTRFAGESFPLCIIQALQVGVPIVSTNVGEIAAMLDVDGVVGGVVVEADPVDARFDALFTDAMHCMVDDDYRTRMASGARVLGERYDMGAFTDKYVAIYEDVLRKFALPQPAVDQERVE